MAQGIPSSAPGQSLRNAAMLNRSISSRTGISSAAASGTVTTMASSGHTQRTKAGSRSALADPGEDHARHRQRMKCQSVISGTVKRFAPQPDRPVTERCRPARNSAADCAGRSCSDRSAQIDQEVGSVTPFQERTRRSLLARSTPLMGPQSSPRRARGDRREVGPHPAPLRVAGAGHRPRCRQTSRGHLLPCHTCSMCS